MWEQMTSGRGKVTKSDLTLNKKVSSIKVSTHHIKSKLLNKGEGGNVKKGSY